MDPNTNIDEQRAHAHFISVLDIDDLTDHEQQSLNEKALRLAELVIALDEWREAGGLDPYAVDA